MSRPLSELRQMIKPSVQIAARLKAEELMADLHRSQLNRQQALDEAALHHDHPGFVEALIDEMSQPHMQKAFIKQCQDIVESKDDGAVNPAFARAVRRVAIEFFGEPI